MAHELLALRKRIAELESTATATPELSPREQLAELITGSPGVGEYDGYLLACRIARAGWRPPARVIETPENEGDYTPAIASLDALPRGTVVQVRSHVFQGNGSGWWEAVGRLRSFSTEQLVDVADGDLITVLHNPGNGMEKQ
jgi:hypothetical protein